MRGVSQQELADNCDVAKSTIQRIEKGGMNPSIITLVKISITLDVELSELTGNTLKPFKTTIK